MQRQSEPIHHQPDPPKRQGLGMTAAGVGSGVLRLAIMDDSSDVTGQSCERCAGLYRGGLRRVNADKLLDSARRAGIIAGQSRRIGVLE